MDPNVLLMSVIIVQAEAKLDTAALRPFMDHHAVVGSFIIARPDISREGRWVSELAAEILRFEAVENERNGVDPDSQGDRILVFVNEKVRDLNAASLRSHQRD